MILIKKFVGFRSERDNDMNFNLMSIKEGRTSGGAMEGVAFHKEPKFLDVLSRV